MPVHFLKTDFSLVSLQKVGRQLFKKSGIFPIAQPVHGAVDSTDSREQQCDINFTAERIQIFPDFKDEAGSAGNISGSVQYALFKIKVDSPPFTLR